ncbi:MAG: LPS-assembly protein LptD [Flavobacteriales bacterium]|jgi:lipopolysaccharide export system protein LptA|nr:LPS-assembly protein LptD [Flavobacteriales bacterium]MBT3963380.1 LPS-assembly protein LptD [Flavobacteriales bacterium]MBT4704528.1 LPS-assembly protein LptD [Flavobacteriales bacterium]MBT4931283.1 LPS-assembly protein LptD [Flavobacteriales bacterium]MBT5131888.1 LPS-assembly protein LptD [Flavobacteriales bacterium]
MLGQLASAQESDSAQLSQNDTLTLDSAAIAALKDSVSNGDSIAAKTRQSTLDHEVDYQSVDSMRVDLRTQMVYLYGDAVATYGDINLNADFIEISLKSNELMATGLPDSTGEIVGKPVFNQGDQNFRSEEMRYNFKTQKGLSKSVITQEGEGFLHGERVKKDTSDVIYIKNGKYTTCEYDDPHFHIHANKLKVITGDKIVTGPAYLSIAGIPTPLAVPFGFFPNNEEQANGLLIPSWGESQGQGFYLSRGGYYFGLNDVMDFSLTGDIYSRGSWAVYLESRYKRRYKFNGGYTLQFVQSRFSEKEYPDFYTNSTFNVRWRHSQDAKARPGSSFSADVNAGSSKNYRNNIQATSANYLKSQLNSSIRYSKSFANTPFSLSMAASGNQNTQTEIVSIRAPEASLNMSRIFPFKGNVPAKGIKKAFGLDKVGVNASADLSNKLTGREDTLFKENSFRNIQNGLKINSTASTNMKLFKYLTITPSTTHRLVGYRSTIRKRWNMDSARIDEVRNDGIDGFYEGSASLTASTVIYGTFQFKNQIFRALRHQITPSASLSYKPDFSDPIWGYYSTVKSDSLGNEQDYSYFENGIYGRPQAQENGVVNFSLNNMFEAKVKAFKDSTKEETKLRLLDAFNFNTSYNLAKDSINWNPVRITVRTQIIPGLVLNGGATLDPYATNAEGFTINEYQFSQDQRLGRWTSANAALSYRIQPKKKKKDADKKKDQLQNNNMYYDDFVDFDIPWRIALTYNLNYRLNGNKDVITQVIDMNGEVNVTKNWRVGFKTGYDFKLEKLSYTSFDIYRNLHCWEFSLGVVPFGSRQSYNFQINVKSSILQDLKLNRRRTFAVPER